MNEKSLYVLCEKNVAWVQCRKVVEIWLEILEPGVSEVFITRFKEFFLGLLLTEHDKGEKIVLVNLDGNSYSGIWTPLCFTGISPKNFTGNYHGAQLKRVILYPSGIIKVDFKDNHPTEWIGLETEELKSECDMAMSWEKCRMVVDLWLSVIDKGRLTEEQIDHFEEIFLAILLVEYSKGKTVQTYRPENYKGIWTPLWFAGIPPKFFCGEYNGDHLRRVTLYPDGKIKVAYVGENKTEDWL